MKIWAHLKQLGVQTQTKHLDEDKLPNYRTVHTVISSGSRKKNKIQRTEHC